MWLDAADRTSLTLSSGSNVTTWRDKSGKGNNATQATVSNQPTTGTLVNGLNVLDFTGTQPFFSLPTIDHTNITVFTIFRNTTLRGFCSPLFLGPFFFFYTNGAGNSVIGTGRLGINDEGTVSQATAGITTANYLLYSLNLTVGATDVVNFYINGSNVANFNGAASGGRTYYQIGSTDTVGATTGFIAEVLIYSGVLNNAQRQQTEGYLAAKWGLLSSMTSTHPFKRIPPFLRPFSPLDISGCALWFDAADPSTMSLTGSSMTQWRDKSGNGCNATGVNNPTYSNNTVNFVRSSSQYFTLPNGSLPSGDSAYSYFVLCKFDNDTTGCALIGGGSFGSSRQVFGFRNLGGETANSLLTYWWGADLAAPANRYTPNTNIIAGSFYAPGVTSGRTMFVNGTQIAADSPAARSQTTINNRIGSTNNGEFMSGTISEIVVYSSSLAPSRRQQVEGYLADKWGLRGSIPSTHPFKLSTTLSLPFSPDQLPGCALWFDGADRGVLTLSGSNVTQWNDKSGNARNTNSVTGTPTWISNSVNKQWGVYFNGSSHFYGDFTYSANTLSSFVVATIESDGASDGRLFSVCTTTAEDFGTALGMNVFSRIGTTTEIATFRNFSFAGRGMNISYATPFLVESILDGTSNAAFTNGNSATGGATSGNFGFTRYAIANSAGTNNAQRNKGFIFEVVMYTTVLTQSQRQQVEGYLSQKWGLKPSLPAAHPYKQSIT